MDPIEEVERQYQRIMLNPASSRNAFPSREILVWLEGIVVRLIEPYLSQPDFQAHATWSIRSLTANSGAPERQVVEAVDRALVAAACALRDAACLPDIEPHLRRLNATPETSQAAPATIRFGTVPPQRPMPRSAVWTSQVEFIATRPWTDLVNPSDLFAPRPDRMLRDQSPDRPGDGGMIGSLNPELPLVGDLVSHYALRRLQIWMLSLEEPRRAYLGAVRLSGAGELPAVRAEAAAWATLETRARALRTMCLANPQAAMREDLMVLTQAYNAFHLQPLLDWLDLPAEILRYGAGLLRNAVLDRHRSEITDRVATAVRSLRLLDEAIPANRSEVDRVIRAGGLVLIKRPRAAYWANRRVDVDWDRHARDWELLLKLVEKAKLGTAVDHHDLYTESKATSTMSTRKNRLCTVLPLDLKKYIVSSGSGSYKLDLPAKQFRIFETE